MVMWVMLYVMFCMVVNVKRLIFRCCQVLGFWWTYVHCTMARWNSKLVSLSKQNICVWDTIWDVTWPNYFIIFCFTNRKVSLHLIRFHWLVHYQTKTNFMLCDIELFQFKCFRYKGIIETLLVLLWWSECWDSDIPPED